jgi:hypothetical protein
LIGDQEADDVGDRALGERVPLQPGQEDHDTSTDDSVSLACLSKPRTAEAVTQRSADAHGASGLSQNDGCARDARGCRVHSVYSAP